MIITRSGKRVIYKKQEADNGVEPKPRETDGGEIITKEDPAPHVPDVGNQQSADAIRDATLKTVHDLSTGQRSELQEDHGDPGTPEGGVNEDH